MVSIELTNDVIREILENKEAECSNCKSKDLSFRENKGRIRCDDCGRIREEGDFRDFIPNFRVIEKTSKNISKNLRIPLVIYKCEDITINSDIRAALAVKKSNVTVLGDVRGDKFFGSVSDDSRFMNPSNAIECSDSVVKVAGDVYDVYSANSDVTINGNVDFSLRALYGSKVFIKGDCKMVRAKDGSEVKVEGNVTKDIYTDEDSNVEILNK